MSGENYINHVCLVIDASGSMDFRKKEVVKVADNQVKWLAESSQKLDQETRVSIYTFGSTVRCLVYDKDVLRLPSISSLYKISGMTKLIDASIKSIEDLQQTATLYGDHAFLVFVLTDGLENDSRHKPFTLQQTLNNLPEEWTIGVLVPDQRGVFEAKSLGFAPDNISVWNVNETMEVGETIRHATERFMDNRAKGIRGTRSLFSTGADAVNKQTVSTLKPLANFHMIPVSDVSPIREFVQSRGLVYQIGKAFYQLTKTETIQSTKKIAIREKSTGKVFSGNDARSILGLNTATVRVTPDYNPLYDVFVQSTSVNRKLMSGTDLLVID